MFSNNKAPSAFSHAVTSHQIMNHPDQSSQKSPSAVLADPFKEHATGAESAKWELNYVMDLVAALEEAREASNKHISNARDRIQRLEASFDLAKRFKSKIGKKQAKASKTLAALTQYTFNEINSTEAKLKKVKSKAKKQSGHFHKMLTELRTMIDNQGQVIATLKRDNENMKSTISHQAAEIADQTEAREETRVSMAAMTATQQSQKTKITRLRCALSDKEFEINQLRSSQRVSKMLLEAHKLEVLSRLASQGQQISGLQFDVNRMKAYQDLYDSDLKQLKTGLQDSITALQKSFKDGNKDLKDLPVLKPEHDFVPNEEEVDESRVMEEVFRVFEKETVKRAEESTSVEENINPNRHTFRESKAPSPVPNVCPDDGSTSSLDEHSDPMTTDSEIEYATSNSITEYSSEDEGAPTKSSRGTEVPIVDEVSTIKGTAGAFGETERSSEYYIPELKVNNRESIPSPGLSVLIPKHSSALESGPNTAFEIVEETCKGQGSAQGEASGVTDEVYQANLSSSPPDSSKKAGSTPYLISGIGISESFEVPRTIKVSEVLRAHKEIVSKPKHDGEWLSGTAAVKTSQTAGKSLKDLKRARKAAAKAAKTTIRKVKS